MENENEQRVCNLDISFDLNDSVEEQLEKSENIQHESRVEYAGGDGKMCIQSDEINDDEKFQVSLNISFDHSDLEPISNGNKSFSTPKQVSKSLGILKLRI